jgi:hypothetical protein
MLESSIAAGVAPEGVGCLKSEERRAEFRPKSWRRNM